MCDSIIVFNTLDNTREEILEATYLSLCEHGYAGLTITKISQNLDKSRSVVYDYYDTKENLLLDLVKHLLGILEDEIMA